MPYSTHLIPTVTDCDTVITQVIKIKRNLEYRQLSFNRQVTAMLTDAASLPQKLVEHDTTVAGLTTAFNSAVPGPQKNKLEKKINLKEIVRRALVDKIAARGPIASLRKQYNLEFIEEQLLEVELYKTAVEERRAALVAEAPAA